MPTPQTQRQITQPHTALTLWSLGPDGPDLAPGLYGPGEAIPGGCTETQARRLLGQAALAAILQWKFVPRTVHGHTVATNGVCQDIHFKLNP